MNQYESARIVRNLLKKRASTLRRERWGENVFFRDHTDKEVRTLPKEQVQKTLENLSENTPKKQRRNRIRQFKLFVLSIGLTVAVVYVLYYLLFINQI